MLDRRAFLKAGGVALFTLGAGPSFLERTVLATDSGGRIGRRPVLVTIFQRGAMDGLMAVSPLGNEALRRARPRLHMDVGRGVGADALIDLDVGFGLHPALASLLPLWEDGRLGIVHCVGSPDPTRSHFDAQDYMETGTPGRKGTPDGWLNRVAGRLGHDATPFRSVSITPALPRSLYGPTPALAVTDLRNFRVGDMGAAGGSPAGKGFEALYQEASQDLLRDTAHGTFEAVRELERLDVRKYKPSPAAQYPRSPLGKALQQIALLIKADVGLELAFAESGGWDTHVQQGTTNGSFARVARDLALSISALVTDLGTLSDNVTVMTMTEFGRTVAENGTGGTDHGHGSCLFVAGKRVVGRQVHGRFPDLKTGALYAGRDLPATTDFRSVFSEVAGKVFGIADDDALFPGWKGPRLPLLRA
jgi:uncharacterized protein (DUF1501 family)